jgi:hypothetical protein
MKLTLDQKINSLKKGEQLQIGKSDKVKTLAERSSDGKELRFIREFNNGSWEIYHRCRF